MYVSDPRRRKKTTCLLSHGLKKRMRDCKLNLLQGEEMKFNKHCAPYGTLSQIVLRFSMKLSFFFYFMHVGDIIEIIIECFIHAVRT